MTPKLTHWTERSIDDFQYRIATDFVSQLSKRMETPPKISQKKLAVILSVSGGRVSQVFNDPGNLSLKSIIRYARALGMKVAVVAYDDSDPSNERGPINSEIFQRCWSHCGNPRDFFELDEKIQWEEQADVFTYPTFDLPMRIPARSYRRQEDRTITAMVGPRFELCESAATSSSNPEGSL